MKTISRLHIFQKAWPIILANAAVPTLGLVDAAIIGNTGSTEDLAAIALGALIFNFIYWSFGFLRMSTTGFVAQAFGAKDSLAVVESLLRPLCIGLVIGCFVIALQWPLQHLIFKAFHSSNDVESIAQQYFFIRIFGAPATLILFALIGTLIGLGKTKQLLVIQLFLNGLNIILDYVFAALLNMGVSGIALGTLLSEWITVFFAGIWVFRLVWQKHLREKLQLSTIFGWKNIQKTLASNSNIFIRTFLLLFSFYWFTDQSAQFSADVLAANHLLLLIISFSAFFIDGFAFVTESIVGQAIGEKKSSNLNKAICYSTELSFITSLLLGIFFYLIGANFISALTDLDTVRVLAIQFLPFACIYIFLSFAAFQLDGIFIGATQTRAMRNASIISAGIFLGVSFPLIDTAENYGLWIAFIIYVVLRAMTLLFYYPAISKELSKKNLNY